MFYCIKVGFYGEGIIVSVEWAKKIVPWEFHDDL